MPAMSSSDRTQEGPLSPGKVQPTTGSGGASSSSTSTMQQIDGAGEPDPKRVSTTTAKGGGRDSQVSGTSPVPPGGLSDRQINYWRQSFVNLQKMVGQDAGWWAIIYAGSKKKNEVKIKNLIFTPSQLKEFIRRYDKVQHLFDSRPNPFLSDKVKEKAEKAREKAKAARLAQKQELASARAKRASSTTSAAKKDNTSATSSSSSTALPTQQLLGNIKSSDGASSFLQMLAKNKREKEEQKARLEGGAAGGAASSSTTTGGAAFSSISLASKLISGSAAASTSSSSSIGRIGGDAAYYQPNPRLTTLKTEPGQQGGGTTTGTSSSSSAVYPPAESSTKPANTTKRLLKRQKSNASDGRSNSPQSLTEQGAGPAVKKLKSESKKTLKRLPSGPSASPNQSKRSPRNLFASGSFDSRGVGVNLFGTTSADINSGTAPGNTRTGGTSSSSSTYANPSNKQNQAPNNATTANGNGTSSSSTAGTGASTSSSSVPIPGANLQKVSEVKAFFQQYGIPHAHLIEKKEFFDMKKKFDDLFVSNGNSVAKAAEQLRIEHNGVAGMMSTNSGFTPSAGGQPSFGANAANNGGSDEVPGESEAARQARLADLRARRGRRGNSPMRFQPAPRANAAPTNPAPHQSRVNKPPEQNTAAQLNPREKQILEDAREIVRHKEYGKWAYDVLGVSWRTATLSDVQKKWKLLMVKYHPDKSVGITNANDREVISNAFDKIKRAQKIAEDEIKRMHYRTPELIRGIRAVPLCEIAGQRAYRITWKPPTTGESASYLEETPQIEKYHIQVFDPRFGKFLTVSVLEGDYDVEAKRVLKIEEINSFKLEEAAIGKLAHIFDQEEIKVQICAENKAGQGPYTQYSWKRNQQKTSKTNGMLVSSSSGGTGNYMNRMQTGPNLGNGTKFGVNMGSSSSGTSSFSFRTASSLQNKNKGASSSAGAASSRPQQAGGGSSSSRPDPFGFGSGNSGSSLFEQFGKGATVADVTSQAKKEQKLQAFERDLELQIKLPRADKVKFTAWLEKTLITTRKAYLAKHRWPTGGKAPELNARVATFVAMKYGLGWEE
ncbi:unnamed protein product [Amoebophrya sp. A25]|nr:unnamed protein product [Amoebophrya sp. A25]|eukprot:GSA25T00001314001.1